MPPPITRLARPPRIRRTNRDSPLILARNSSRPPPNPLFGDGRGKKRLIGNHTQSCVSDMILYHASKEIVEFPEIRKGRFTKDFSWGFYCTVLYQQAVRWANRGSGEPIINHYEYVFHEGLSYLKFEEVNDAWLDFIAQCRNGYVHPYDIVEGPMADDTIWNHVNDYLAGKISRKQFWVLAEFKYPTHQMSFHTIRALDCLRFIKSEVVYGNQSR